MLAMLVLARHGLILFLCSFALFSAGLVLLCLPLAVSVMVVEPGAPVLLLGQLWVVRL